jgi:GNAT superfamily N-acetyltransferase
MPTADQLHVRRAEASDLPEIIDVCGRALDWPDDGVNAGFFSWKHVENPFGPSPIWLAEDGEGSDRRIVGVRAMLRWELKRAGGDPQPMTRAVDTATLPEHQGRGIFTRLTMAAVEQLSADGVSAVFNTPNDKCRPGYLKMGWETIGRVPVTVRPRSPLTIAAMVRSRTAADKWGTPTEAGVDAAEAFAEPDGVERALANDRTTGRWSTPLSVEYLRWRTAFTPLHCRVEPLGPSIDRGFVVFRVRRRGALRQLSVLHVVSPDRGRSVGRAIAHLLRQSGADLAMSSGGELGIGAGMLPFPSTGPILTWRPLAEPEIPGGADLRLPLGTIELF